MGGTDMDFIGLLRTLEAITRPPRLGHDVDVEDGAAQLAEREAAEEVSEPEDDSLACPYPDCARYVDHRGPHEFPWGDSIPWPPEADNDYADTSNPTEPGLTPDELVGVRGLLQERYEERGWAACRRLDDELERLGIRKSSASNHAGTGAEPALGEEPEESLTASLAHPPGYYTLMTDTFASNLYGFPDRPITGDEHTASDGGKWIYELLGTKGVWDATNYPSPTIVQSAPPPTVDGGAGGGGALHSPGARLPHPDDAVAEWIGEAVPVINEVLAGHYPVYSTANPFIWCLDLPNHHASHAHFDDEAGWRAHVSPLIANALAPQDK